MKVGKVVNSQNIPALFQEIIREYKIAQPVLDAPIVEFFSGQILLRRRRELRRAAEKALSWNANKGSTA